MISDGNFSIHHHFKVETLLICSKKWNAPDRCCSTLLSSALPGQYVFFVRHCWDISAPTRVHYFLLYSERGKKQFRFLSHITLSKFETHFSLFYQLNSNSTIFPLGPSHSLRLAVHHIRTARVLPAGAQTTILLLHPLSCTEAPLCSTAARSATPTRPTCTVWTR